jgi:hypothetical protein
MRIGSGSLGEFPLDVVRIECERCGRAGSYRRDGLLARFSQDAALPDVLMALATCERRQDFSQPCGARFTDLRQTAQLRNCTTISVQWHNGATRHRGRD